MGIDQPTLAATEFFSYALLEAGMTHLTNLDDIRFLIRGDTFTPEEKRL